MLCFSASAMSSCQSTVSMHVSHGLGFAIGTALFPNSCGKKRFGHTKWIGSGPRSGMRVGSVSVLSQELGIGSLVVREVAAIECILGGGGVVGGGGGKVKMWGSSQWR